MTGKEFIDALQATGTGENKLAPGRALLKAKPDAGATDVLQAMVTAKVSEITLDKAEKLLARVPAAPKTPVKAAAPAPAPAPPPPKSPEKPHPPQAKK